MATTITITEQDRVDAENILEQFLGDKLPGGDFGKGGALRDFAVVALSLIFAYLKKEGDLIRARQSLLLLGGILDQTDVDDAVDEILSNWFISRKTGRKSRGTATVYFSQQGDVNIPTNAAFFKSSSLLFYPDSDSILTYSSDDMTAIVDSTGVVIEYALTVPLIAANSGAGYDIDPGPFVDFSRFNVYVTRVENTTKFSGGLSTEDTASMLSRSESAISVRTLNSPRSIDVTLKEEFTDIDDLIVIGFGDDEMIRDLIEEAATNTRIHAGGFTDIYLRNPILEEKIFATTVGSEFTDPRPGFYILRDDTVADFETAVVIRGDLIMIVNNLSDEPDQFIVNSVSPYGVYVSRRSQFTRELPVVETAYTDGQVGNTYTSSTNEIKGGNHTFTASDVDKYVRIKNSGAGNDGTWKISVVDTINNEATLVGANFTDESGVVWDLQTRVVRYSIGDNSPLFNDKVSERDSGRFTKSIQHDGRVLLPNWPVYRIREIYVTDPSHPWADTSGRVYFEGPEMTPEVHDLAGRKERRVNVTPVAAVSGDFLQYRLIGHNPGEVPSGWQVLELELGFTAGNDFTEFNGKPITIIYDTLTGFDSIWAYTVGTDKRILCGSVIPKGLHPVYLSMNISYKLAKTATNALDTSAAATALAAYINNFDTREDMDTSDVSSFLRENYDVIGYIAPLTIYYVLLSPDGRRIFYVTTDEVIVDPTKHRYPSESERSLDPTATAPYNASAIALGVSDNTVRYLTAADLITFTQVVS